MGKVSLADKMRMQTLREQGYGAKAIVAAMRRIAYPLNNWKLSTMQNWLQTNNCPDFIAKDQWPPNSPDLNPLDYHV